MSLKELLGTNERPEFIDVELTGITVGADERPLVARIYRPDRKALAEKMKVLPGDRPDEPGTSAGDDEQLLELGESLIPAFIQVQLPDGSWRCPAFSFAKPPDPDLLDGSLLTYVDVSKLTLAVMSLGGYLKRGAGESAPATFLGERGGSAGVGGAPSAGEGVRPDPGASAA